MRFLIVNVSPFPITSETFWASHSTSILSRTMSSGSRLRGLVKVENWSMVGVVALAKTGLVVTFRCIGATTVLLSELLSSLCESFACEEGVLEYFSLVLGVAYFSRSENDGEQPRIEGRG